MTPNYKQLTDVNYNIRPITFNDISNQDQINQTDQNGKIYTHTIILIPTLVIHRRIL